MLFPMTVSIRSFHFRSISVGNHRRRCRVAFLLILYIALTGLLSAAMQTASAEEDPFAAGVRPTEPLSPAEEQKTFTLPPGFEIQLFAAEPEIFKPMNMA